jgi:hypothetical protein
VGREVATVRESPTGQPAIEAMIAQSSGDGAPFEEHSAIITKPLSRVFQYL